MFTPIIGIAPISELLQLFCYQHFDSLAQLFFEESGIKTHPAKDGFKIIEHSHSSKKRF
jgi:hypothetical protein